MVFCDIRNIRLEDTCLIAECRPSSGNWQQSILDLNRCVGNSMGSFRWNGQDFSQSARDVRLEGFTLYAQLATPDTIWLDASLDLDECITNEEGHLRFYSKAGPGDATLDNAILRANYISSSGEAKQSSLDLDNYLGNNEGEFEVGEHNFSLSAEDIRLSGTMIHARLATPWGEWCDASVDLNDWLGNNDGKLHWKEESEIGWETNNCGDHEGRLLRWSPPHFLSERKRRQRDEEEARSHMLRRHAQEKKILRPNWFTHKTLTKDSNIRLLKIGPSEEESDGIACSLIEVDLDECPSFAALSYTWGSPFQPTISSIEEQYQQTTTIRCDGQPFRVKQNLCDALHRLRQRTATQESQVSLDRTNLLSGVQSGSLVEVEHMLRLGADVGMRDSSGRTALHWAAKFGHLNITKALLVAGSDINVVCDLNKKPLDYAREGCGPYVKSVQDFLVERQNSGITVRRANSSLRLDVTETNWFWIDAVRRLFALSCLFITANETLVIQLCINQDDEKEKAAQVAIMGNIYRSARHVIVWLGREYHDFQDDTEQLLQGSWRLELGRDQEGIPKGTLEQLTNDPVKTFQVHQDSKIMHTAIDWLNTIGLNTIETWFRVPHIFRRTWFDRAWILQEVVMAKDVTVVCGPYILPWDIFLFMSSIVECCRRLLGTAGIASVFETSKWDELYETQLRRGARSLSSFSSSSSVADGLSTRRAAFNGSCALLESQPGSY
jgi:hypothetical protein